MRLVFSEQASNLNSLPLELFPPSQKLRSTLLVINQQSVFLSIAIFQSSFKSVNL